MKNKTLLVDGNALFKTAYFGAKRLLFKNEKIGGIFQSVNMIRKLVNENHCNKVVVMWDGEGSILSRLKLYPYYKNNRNQNLSDDEMDNYQYQKLRVKQYLEELFIRQYITHSCESDDVIAYYANNRKPDELVLVATNDRDLLQLLNENVSVYLFDKKYVITPDNFMVFFPYHYKNVKVLKIITGDKSDNIHGIQGLGASDVATGKLVELVPELRQREVTLQEIFDVCEKNKTMTICQNILTGKSPKGIFGNEFYQINEQIINLEKPLIDDQDKNEVNILLHKSLDPTDRRFKNLLSMMIKDGTIHLIPGKIDRWEEFVQPFIRVVRNEKHN
jgi:DNA polymerase-1